MRTRQAFIKIDEQGWYCHFRTGSPKPLRCVYWKIGCWLLAILRSSNKVEVVNTFDPDGGDKVSRIN